MIEVATIRVQNPRVIGEAWSRLINFAQKNPYCKMELTIRDGVPYIAEVIKESIKFS